MHVAILLVAVAVALMCLAATWPRSDEEHYTRDTGADWLRGAWETLVPGECVDFGVIVDKLGARQGEFIYFDDPRDLSVYRDILAEGSDGFTRIDASWASSRAEVALNPASKYHKALTSMDEMSEKYRNELSGMNIWFLPGGAPARFDRLAVGVLSDRRVAANGVHVWKIDGAVAARPRESAHGVISLFSYAKLLTDLDQGTRDFDAMQNEMKREDVLTATTMLAVDDTVKRAAGVIKAEQQAAQEQLWRAAKTNSDAADVVRQRALKLSKIAGDDTDTSKKELKYAAAADTQRKGVDSTNEGLERTGKMYRMEVANVSAGAASIEGTANQMKVTNWAEYEEALGKIDDLSRERTRLDSQTAELSGKLANMQERVAYLSHPSRMDANKASLARALDDLKKATADLEKNLNDADAVSENQNYLQRAVDDLKTGRTNAQAYSTQATFDSEQAYKVVGDLRGRLEAAKAFSQERSKLEASMTGERTNEQKARDAMSSANSAVAASDGNPRLIMCTAEYAAQRQRALDEADRQRKAAAEAAAAAAAAAAERERLARIPPPPPPPPAPKPPPPPAPKPPPPPPPPPAAPKCNPDACNKILDDWRNKNWAYTSSQFSECNGCQVIQSPRRMPGGAPEPPKPVTWSEKVGIRMQGNKIGFLKTDAVPYDGGKAATKDSNVQKCKKSCEDQPKCRGFYYDSRSCEYYHMEGVSLSNIVSINNINKPGTTTYSNSR